MIPFLSQDVPITLFLHAGCYTLNETLVIKSVHLFMEGLPSGTDGSAPTVRLRCRPKMTGPALLIRSLPGATLLISDIEIAGGCPDAAMQVQDAIPQVDAKSPLSPVGHIDVVRCSFSGNSGGISGGLLINTTWANVRIASSLFTRNMIHSPATVGTVSRSPASQSVGHAALVILSQSGTVLIKGTLFEGNGPQTHSDEELGAKSSTLGIACAAEVEGTLTPSCSLQLEGSIWRSNSASYSSGASLACGLTSCSATDQSCIFTDNRHLHSLNKNEF